MDFYNFLNTLRFMDRQENASDQGNSQSRMTISLKNGMLCIASPVEFSEACFVVPAVRALKRLRGDEKMCVLSPRYQEFFWNTVSEIDEVISYDEGMSVRKIACLLENQEFSIDVAVVWERGNVAKALARIGVGQRLGPLVGRDAKYVTDVVTVASEPGPIEHRVRYYLKWIEQLGGDGFVKSNFRPVPIAAPRSVGKPFKIALAMDSEYGESYRWGKEKWDAFKQMAEEKWGELEWVEIQKREVDKKKESSAVFNPTQELLTCSALVACDGEIAHWAAHYGLSAIVLFGPGEPAWKRPLGKQSRVVREHVACSPCYLEKCPLDHRCLQGISPQRVMEELECAQEEISPAENG